MGLKQFAALTELGRCNTNGSGATVRSATKMYFYCKVVKTQFLIESTNFLN